MPDIRNTKVFELYQGLTEAEIADLKMWMRLKGESKLVKGAWSDFFACLDHAIREETFAGEAIWQVYFKGSPYDDVKWRKILSHLYSFLKGYFSTLALAGSPSQQAHLVIQELNARNMENLAGKEIRMSQKLFEKEGATNEFDHLYAHLIGVEAHNLDHKQGERFSQENFNQLEQELDRFYFISKLKLLCERANRKNVSAFYISESDTDLLKLISRQIEASQASKSTEIYFHIFNMLSLNGEAAEEHFGFVRRQWVQLSAASDSLNEDLWNIFNYCLNFCIGKVNQGEPAYYSTLFEMYLSGLDSGAILVDGHLPVWHYKNITTTAVKLIKRGTNLVDLDWLGKFIEEQKGLVQENHRETIFQYNRAYLAFAKNDFRQASLILLQDSDFPDEFIKPDSRWLLLKCYYEQQNWDPLVALLLSFRKYLNRNRFLSPGRIESHKKRLKYLKKLIDLPAGPSRAATSLEQSIEADEKLPDRDWFLRKISEIEGGK